MSGKVMKRRTNENITDIKKRTIRSFSYEWKNFPKLYKEYKDQFLDWIYPIESDFFRNKLVLDAGCGLGRHAYYAAEFGAEVVGLDISEAVEVAHENTRSFSKVHIVRGDIYYPPLRKRFDFVYSIGVIHHLPNPEKGFRTVLDLVKNGGSIFVWVYGRENNLFMTRVVEPLRRITTRLPLAMLDALCYPATLILHITTKLYSKLNRAELTRNLSQILPYRQYFLQISDFCFEHKLSIVFDFLSVPLCHYYSKEEFEAWFKRMGLKEIVISWRNKNSWRGWGKKPSKSETSKRSKNFEFG